MPPQRPRSGRRSARMNPNFVHTRNASTDARAYEFASKKTIEAKRHGSDIVLASPPPAQCSYRKCRQGTVARHRATAETQSHRRNTKPPQKHEATAETRSHRRNTEPPQKQGAGTGAGRGTGAVAEQRAGTRAVAVTAQAHGRSQKQSQSQARSTDTRRGRRQIRQMAVADGRQGSDLERERHDCGAR